MSIIQLMTPEYKDFTTHFSGIIDRSKPESPTIVSMPSDLATPPSDETAKPKSAPKKKAEPKSGGSGRPNIVAARKGRK